MDPAQLSQSIKSAATQAGFEWCGICPAVTPVGLSRFHQWLEAGYHGEMEYLERRKDAYAHPRFVLEGARSVVILALSYKTKKAHPAGMGFGQVSRYAWGTEDYHDLIHQKLKSLKSLVNKWAPDAGVRGVVDTAPLLEREFATLSGLGWQGKNTLILNKSAGSWFFLAALLLDVVLDYDQPHESSHCGTCTACLDACPTNAFVGPNLLDARKCISYLTIELRKPVPVELRSQIGDWIFGCDVCQNVCPWNTKATESAVTEFRPDPQSNPVDLKKLFDLNDDTFRARFRKTPLWRSKRRGILRNAAIALGNQKCSTAIPALSKGLNDPEPLIRGASAWALGTIGGAAAVKLLREQLAKESDPEVLEEIDRFV